MDRYWTASEASLPEGPFTRVSAAHEVALRLSKALSEPVGVFSGPFIARWTQVEEVRFSDL